MLQFKVPQDVQREDRIVAFLTLKQLIICMAGGSIAYLIYLSLAKEYFMEVWLPPVGLVGILTLAIAFLKINDIPFVKFALLTVGFYFTPRKRQWYQGGGDPLRSAFQNIMKKTKEEKKSEKKQKEIKITMERIDEISKILDKHSRNITSTKEKNDKLL